MLDEIDKQEVIQMKRNLQEKAILGQIASLLVQEQLINPEEQIRFLTFLKEED
jgi:hypothetical protein